MSNIEKKKNNIEWYNEPTIITNLLILMIVLIVILSQSFAVNNGLSVGEILSSILNHNISYLLVFIYFVALKTKVGKRYFDFSNIFLIILHTLIAVTSLLTVLQSFGLGSLLAFAIDGVILVYAIHTFLRSTRMWKSLSLNKSPFNEINNSSYFYSIVVMSITLLAVNLVSTTSLDGTILTLMDTAYILLFARYIFLYGEYLNNKKIAVNNEGNFDEYKEMITDVVDDIKEKIEDIKDDIKDKTKEIKNNIEDKIEDAKIDEKIDVVKDKVSDIAADIKEKVEDIKDKKKSITKDKVNESKKGNK